MCTELEWVNDWIQLVALCGKCANINVGAVGTFIAIFPTLHDAYPVIVDCANHQVHDW
jgi:hypothetical protein